MTIDDPSRGGRARPPREPAVICSPGTKQRREGACVTPLLNEPMRSHVCVAPSVENDEKGSKA